MSLCATFSSMAKSLRIAMLVPVSAPKAGSIGTNVLAFGGGLAHAHDASRRGRGALLRGGGRRRGSVRRRASSRSASPCRARASRRPRARGGSGSGRPPGSDRTRSFDECVPIRQRSPSKTSAREAIAPRSRSIARVSRGMAIVSMSCRRCGLDCSRRLAIVGGSSVVSGKNERPVRGVPAADGCGVGGDRSTCLASPARATASGASLGSPTGVASRGAEGGGVAGDWTSQTRIGDHTSVRSAVRSFRGGPSFLRRVGASPTRIRCRDSRGERALGGGARGPRGGAAPRRASRRR